MESLIVDSNPQKHSASALKEEFDYGNLSRISSLNRFSESEDGKTVESEAVKGKPLKRRTLDVYYTGNDTKLFVENGVLIEEEIRVRQPISSRPMPYDHPCVYNIHSPFATPWLRPSVDDAGKSRQHKAVAESALQYYNSKHVIKYELVDIVNCCTKLWQTVNGSVWNAANGSVWDTPKGNGSVMETALWRHINFTAKPETLSRDSPTKLFFGEVKIARVKSSIAEYCATACSPVDDTKAPNHCKMCGEVEIVHPTDCGEAEIVHPTDCGEAEIMHPTDCGEAKIVHPTD